MTTRRIVSCLAIPVTPRLVPIIGRIQHCVVREAAAVPTTPIPTTIDQPHTYGFQSSRLKFTLKSVTQPP